MKYKQGYKEGYDWFEFPENSITIGFLIDNLTELFIGKFLAIKCFDSSTFKPTDEEKQAGWIERKGIAYSPRLTKKELERPICDNYDEWYIFKTKTEIDEVKAFVNFDLFTLSDRRNELETLNLTFDKKGLEYQIEVIEEMQTEFWKAIKQMEPLTYIADGNSCIIVTEDQEFSKKIRSTGGNNA